MSIQSALLTWITEVTNLDAWQAPIDTSKDKPEGEYCTFQIVSIVMSDFNQVDGLATSATNIEKTTKNNATLLLSLNVYAIDGFNKLAQLNASADFWRYRNLLAIEGISINRLGNPQNLTGLGDTNYVDRWQMDMEFRITTEITNDWDRITEISLAGMFLKEDGSGIINSLVKWPLA